MSTPASSARALHGIIAAVDEGISPGQPPYHSWTKVSGYATESSDFARYHAEVVALLSDVVEDLQLLEPSQRERYAHYLPAWWAAVVRPRQDWAAQATEIIDTPSLHVLAMLADLLETRASLTGTATPKAPEILRKAVSLLLADVEDDGELPPTVREQVLADLRHVLWLVDQVDTFGVDHVVDAARKVAGRAASGAVASRAWTLKRVAVTIVTALALAAPVTTSLDNIVTNVKHTFGTTAEASQTDDDVQKVVVQVYNACIPKALDSAAHPRALTGSPGLDSNDVVDAEIVVDKEGR